MRKAFAAITLPNLGGWRSLRQGALGMALLLLAACASAPRPKEATYKPSRSALADLPARAPDGAVGTANDVLFRAIGLVGTPYHWGGNTPDSGFDCSGLIDYIYRTSAGIQLPRTSQQLSEMNGRDVREQDQLISGDLVFFGQRGQISHVGVYVGKGRFVHAPNSGGTVRLDDIDGPYWRSHFAYGKRVLD
jgi:cell wall-associated NlpC family hydrolase